MTLSRAKEVADHPTRFTAADHRQALKRLLNAGWFTSADTLAAHMGAKSRAPVPFRQEKVDG